ncbi:MAG: CdaR family protein [Chloroflexota bacterium]|nr:CdaR family protein [Chloroflexota bacterium]
MQGPLSNNLGSLLLSLALAFIIWITAANNDLERVRNFPLPEQRGIPIELRNVPEGLIVTEGEEQQALVDLLIHQELEDELAPDDLVAYVDLAGAEPGRRQVEVVVERQPFAPSLRLLSTNPNRITVELDEQLTREFPVEVIVPDVGTIASNYQVLTPTVSPPTLTITGPRAQVEPIEEVVAEVEVDGARETVIAQVTPTLLGEEGVVEPEDLDFDTRHLQVTVPIEQKPGYRELIVRTVLTGTSVLAERGYWIRGSETEPLLLAVVGQQDVVEELDGIVETEPVDVSGLEEGLVIRQVPLELPEGISPVDTDFVTVTVNVEPQTSSRTVSLSPRIVGLEPGLVVPDTGIVPNTIDVLLRGPVRELEELNLDEVTATLDLAGEEVGSHLIEPQISAPGNLRAESVIPEQVEVTVVEEPVEPAEQEEPTEQEEPESEAYVAPVKALRVPDEPVVRYARYSRKESV